jgi:predicted Zn-dependent peptidase
MEKSEGNNDILPALVMTDIFGGAPYSRLFTNVREKMSLCYYCSASSVRVKGLLTVDSGVEEANVDKASEEILNQLEIVKNGEFTDFEYESSLKGIADSLRTYNDSQEHLDMWYCVKAVSGNFISPDETAEKIASITKEEIVAAAKNVQLHTVYRLLPKEVK